MRRAVQALLISGVLFPAAACGTAASTPSASVSEAPAVVTAADLSTRAACESLSQVYSRNLAPLAQSLNEMVAARTSAGADKEQERKVKQSLTNFATALELATHDSNDTAVRTDGEKTADQLRARAGDAKFLRTIKTAEDAQKVMGPTLKEWLAPMAKHCS
ncbi:hypothetical protein [Actinoplanes friuliensis]|uniref:Lipoprotein n=1 Tax=Actinoplanes friuliensis DSM 7358 TaxID=1246995 RepID=U5VXA1_9ACTN|nr:hypothetical protein [Actinoplanes friuliensis]AGZ41504.1 hypothetical protein AFR_16110 [Actinoplanes friuliensis DSM 7358]